jgi:hypothetical protein
MVRHFNVDLKWKKIMDMSHTHTQTHALLYASAIYTCCISTNSWEKLNKLFTMD